MDDVKIDGISVGSVSEFTFEDVNADHTIDVTFRPAGPVKYIIEATAGPNGTISPSGAVSVNEGVTQSFIIQANEGYKVKDVVVDGVSAGALTGYTFPAVNAKHTISVTFEEVPPHDEYIIKATAGDNGTIAPSGDVKVNKGENKTFTFTPNAGYEVKEVKVDGVSQGVIYGYTFKNVDADHTIHVEFKKSTVITYDIAATAGANGKISPAGIVTVNEGVNQTFTFTPDAGYVVEDVKVDDVSVGVEYTYTFTNVTANHKIHVTFETGKTYIITATVEGNGAITPVGEVKVNEGANQTFTFAPNAGSAVEDVIVDGVSVGVKSSYTFTNVTVNHTIHVTFSGGISTYTITATTGDNGTVTPSGAVKVNKGASQKFVFTANADYAVADVTIDGVSVGALSDFTFPNVTADHTIHVTFIESGVSYIITATAGANGNITRPVP